MFLRQSTQIKVRIGPAVAVGDGFTPVTTLTLSGADEAEALKANGAATTDISGATFAAVTGADGWFDLTLTTSHTDTVGELIIVVNDDSLILPIFQRFQVIEEAAYDAMFAASAPGYVANAPVNVAQWNGTNVATPDTAGYPKITIKSGTGTGEVSLSSGLVALSSSQTFNMTGNVTGNLSGSVGSVTAGVTLANGAITDASLAGNMEIVFETDFATNYNTTRAAWVTNAQDFVGTTAADPFAGKVVAASVTGAVGSVTGNVGGNVTGSIGSLATQAKADVQQECEEGIVSQGLTRFNQIASGLVGATGTDSTHINMEGVTYGDDEINNYMLIIYDADANEYHARWVEDFANSGTLATVAALPWTPDDADSWFLLAVRQDVTGGSGLDAAGVRAAVGLSTANLDTQLGDIQATADTIDTEAQDIQSRLPDALTAGGNIKADALKINGGTPGTQQTGDSFAVVNSGTFGNSALKTLIDDVPTNSELSTALAAADDATLAAIAALNNLSSSDVVTAVTSWAETAMTESYAANGDPMTPVEALHAILAAVVNFRNVGTTKTMLKLDGTTTAFEATHDDAALPTECIRVP